MSYSIEKANLDTQGQYLRELWHRNFEDVPSQRYAWMYENNPAGQPVVFLLKHDQIGDYVGAMALFPHRQLIKNQQVKGYICGDMAVDYAHRTLGPAMALIKAAVKHCEDNNPCILLSLPNNKSLPVLHRAGFVPLGTYFSLTKVLKTGTYLQRYVKSNRLADSLACFADQFLALYNQMRAFRFGREYEIDLAKEFDHRFDVFTNNAANQLWLAGQRKSVYLQWRLVDSPYGRNDIFVIKKNSQICGYVSFCIRNNRCDIGDFAFDGSTQNLKALLVAFTLYQLKNKIVAISISVAGHEMLIGEFQKAGFSIMGKENQFLIYASPDGLTQQLSSPSGLWYLTAVDNDI